MSYHPDSYYSALELHKLSGVPYQTLRNELPTWLKWRYLLIRYHSRWSKEHRIIHTATYRLSKRGRRWVERIPDNKRMMFEAILREQ